MFTFAFYSDSIRNVVDWHVEFSVDIKRYDEEDANL
jgi:hypothetical protein